jgi:UDP-GlcNAc3NAcA epimerase
VKIVTVVGARPQFIKAAAVSRAIAAHNSRHYDPRTIINEIIVHTGQHFDANMSDIFFEEMQIPLPRYKLQINSISHGAMTGRMLEKIEEILLYEKPDYVMVYGDTNSTLAGAMAAKKLHIKVVHVEAGLRSFNMDMPEEINRILTDRISDILCCPTMNAVENLKREGFENYHCNVTNTGDVMLDAALFYSGYSAEKSTIVKTLGLAAKDFLLCTIHRAENTDNVERLTSIVEALNIISQEMPIILPMHPRTRENLSSCRRKLVFNPIEPVGYFDMIELLKHARLVMTDSGGLQKEAYFFAKPCIILRDETEWLELLEDPCYRAVGTEIDAVTTAFHSVKECMPLIRNGLYGNGMASQNIVATFT